MKSATIKSLYGMEFFLSLRFKKFVREHKEDPWDWLRLGTKEIKKTRLRYHGGLHSGFEFIPECIRRLVIQTVAKYGIDLTRTSNAWNNFEALGKEAKELKKLGMPEQRGIEIDSDAYTPVLRFNGELSTMAFLKRDLSSLGFSLATKGEVLIIGPGGGRDVLMALLYGHHGRRNAALRSVARGELDFRSG